MTSRFLVEFLYSKNGGFRHPLDTTRVLQEKKAEKVGNRTKAMFERLRKETAMAYLERIGCDLLDKCDSMCISNTEPIIRLNMDHPHYARDLAFIESCLGLDLTGIEIQGYQRTEDNYKNEQAGEDTESEEENQGKQNDAVCHICQEEIEVPEVWLTEWLSAAPECEQCHQKTCAGCLATCFDCWNGSMSSDPDFPKEEESPFVCLKCVDSKQLVKFDCKYHTWYHCTKLHGKNKECGECRANRNYARKMEG